LKIGKRAVVTPVTLTTSQSSVVLHGSGSTSASRNLSYLFHRSGGGQSSGYIADADQPQGNRRFCEWSRIVPGSAHGNRCERQYREKSRRYVELPAL